MKLIRNFLLGAFVFLQMNLNATVINDFIRSLDEQTIAVKWVLAQTHDRLDINSAKSIVKAVYEHSYNKYLDPFLILSIIYKESTFNKNAVGYGGSVGLMQVLVSAHNDKLKDKNPFDINTSISIGTTIFKQCYTKHKNVEKALNCYSGGGGKKYSDRVLNAKKKLVKFVFNHSKTNKPVF